MFKKTNIIPQFPSLTKDELMDKEECLKKRFGYNCMPEQYCNYLMKVNGSRFYLFDDEKVKNQIETNLPFIRFSNVSGIFGVWLDRFEGMEPSNVHWPELFASNENSKEDFGILPDNMMSFAYEHESSGSLFSISTDERDFGKVYYYYDGYMYSIIGRKRMLEKHGYCYYDQKLFSTLKKYGVDESRVKKRNVLAKMEPDIVIASIGDISEDCKFEILRNDFVPIADSFEEFMGKLIEVYEP